MEAILTRDSGAQKCKFFFNDGAKFGDGVLSLLNVRRIVHARHELAAPAWILGMTLAAA